MPVNGKLRAGEVLSDPANKPGMVTVVVSVTSGRLPTPIDPKAQSWGSSAETCAIYGGSAHHDARTPGRVHLSQGEA